MSTSLVRRGIQEDLASHISNQRMAVFGHVRRLPEEPPGRQDSVLRLAVDTRTGHRPDNNPCWSGNVDMGDLDIPGSVRCWGFISVAQKDRASQSLRSTQRGYLPSSFENAHSLVDTTELESNE